MIEFDVSEFSDRELEELVDLGGRIGSRASDELIRRQDQRITEEITQRKRAEERARKEKARDHEKQIREKEREAERYFRSLSDEDLRLLSRNPSRGPESQKATDLYLNVPGVVEEWSNFSQADASRYAGKVLEERQTRGDLDAVLRELPRGELEILADSRRVGSSEWEQIARKVRERVGFDVADRRLMEEASEVLAIGGSAPGCRGCGSKSSGGSILDRFLRPGKYS